MINKICRFTIIKPLNIEWKVFGEILRTIQYETYSIANQTSHELWHWNLGYCRKYNDIYNVYPTAKDTTEILDYKSIEAYCYDEYISKRQVRSYSGNVSTTQRNVASHYKPPKDKNKDKKDTVAYKIYAGEIHPPTYKKDLPIDIHNGAFKKIEMIDNDTYSISISLVSTTYKKELNEKYGLSLKNGIIEFMVKTNGNYAKAIIDRIISGEYKVTASQINYIEKKKNNKKIQEWYINLGYKFETAEKQLDTNNVMGVDMGLVFPVYMAFNDSYSRYKIDGGEIESFRRQVEQRKNQLYAQAKYCGEGRVGHGEKTRMKPARLASDKIARFRDTTNHKYSKYVVKMAVKHNCGTIQMEDLSGINEDNAFLKNWSYYDLQQKIKYKAEEKGIKVIKIDPKYTSQRCSSCGFIHHDSRPDQKTFKCVKCDFGHKFYVNADYNAAKNIATPDIENIIKEQVETQKKNGEWKTNIKE